MHGIYDAPDGPDMVTAPNDFPADPVFYHDAPLLAFLAWSVIMALVVWGVYRFVRRNQWESFFAHVKTVKLVEAASRRAQAKAYEAPGQLDPDVVGLINAICGETRRCGKDIREEYGKLEKALSGVKEIEAPPGYGVGGIGENNSGTIINIAVSNSPNGQPVADSIQTGLQNGQAVAQIGAPFTPPPPAPLSHQARIYKSLNNLHDEWKSTRAMAGLLEDARTQLIDTPAWTPPLLPRPGDPVARG